MQHTAVFEQHGIDISVNLIEGIHLNHPHRRFFNISEDALLGSIDLHINDI